MRDRGSDEMDDPFPLHHAVLQDDEDQVKSLLEQQLERHLLERRQAAKGKLSAAAPNAPPRMTVQVNTANSVGQFPLHYAAARGHREILSALIDYGADVNKANRDGETPLLIAAYHGHEASVRLLLDLNADPMRSDGDGWTPLHNAVSRGHLSTARLLLGRLNRLQQGANPRAKSGQTPLMLACSKGALDMVDLLIENGGDPLLRDQFGSTAYDYAALQEHLYICMRLSDWNANLASVCSTAVLEVVVETERASLLSAFAKASIPFTTLSGEPTSLITAALPDKDWFWVTTWRKMIDATCDEEGWRYSKDAEAHWQDMQPAFSRLTWTRRRLWIRLRKLRIDRALEDTFLKDTADARVLETTDRHAALTLYRKAMAAYLAAMRAEPDKEKRDRARGLVAPELSRAEDLARRIREEEELARASAPHEPPQLLPPSLSTESLRPSTTSPTDIKTPVEAQVASSSRSPFDVDSLDHVITREPSEQVAVSEPTELPNEEVNSKPIAESAELSAESAVTLMDDMTLGEQSEASVEVEAPLTPRERTDSLEEPILLQPMEPSHDIHESIEQQQTSSDTEDTTTEETTTSADVPVVSPSASPVASALVSSDESPFRRRSVPSTPSIVWEKDADVSSCRRCARGFGLLVRRHHCRNCGRIFCDACSSHIVNLRGTDSRVCVRCFDLLRSASAEPPPSPSASRPRPVTPAKTLEATSPLNECPVCNEAMDGMRESERAEHIEQCIADMQQSPRGRRYLSHVLPAASPAAAQGLECPICFDEFKPMDQVATMDCLCMYHKECIDDWLMRGTGCPVHSR